MDKKITTQQFTAWLICSIKKGAWAPIVAFSLNILCYLLNLYAIYPCIDIPGHFIGGMGISYFYIQSISCALKYKLIGRPSFFIILLLLFLLTCTTTVFWELLEWGFDIIFYTHLQINLNETMVDMLVGTIGGIVTIGIMMKVLKEKYLTE